MCSAKHTDYYVSDCAVNVECFTITDVIVTQNYLCKGNLSRRCPCRDTMEIGH